MILVHALILASLFALLVLIRRVERRLGELESFYSRHIHHADPRANITTTPK